MNRLMLTVLASLGAVLPALAATAPVLQVGAATLRVLDPPWRAGSLSYQVANGTPVVSAVDVFAASDDWKQRLFDFRDSEITTTDTFAGRRVLLRRQGDFGAAEQEATLGPNQLDLRWSFDFAALAGNLEISVWLPEATMGVSPLEATFQDGSTRQDQLWVEQRAPLRDLRHLAIKTPRQTIAFDFGARGGWEFQDRRRNQDSRGLYRLVLPVYGLKAPFRQEVRLRVTVDPPAAEFAPVALAAAANMGLTDEREGDGHGGWTDQGDNDLRSLPTGLQYLDGIPFQIGEPTGRSALMLRGGDRTYFPTTATVAVGRPAAALYLLHGCAWATPGRTACTVVVRYEDGTTRDVPIRVGQETLDWWGVRDLSENARVAWRGANGRAPVGLMLLRWLNPSPDKPIRDLTFRAGDGPVAGIVAVTVASGPVALGAATTAGATLPPLRVAAAGLTGLDRCWRGTRLDPDWAPADLKQVTDLTAYDLMVVTEDLAASAAARVAERVRGGGRLLVFGPPPAGLADLLPVRMATPPVFRVIAPYWRWGEGEPRAFFLQPVDAGSPLFVGLDPSQMAPTGALYEAAAAPGATVEATWRSTDGQSFPALVRHAVGQGTVTYFNFPRLYPASGGIDYARIFTALNRYWDPFLIKLAYHAAGQDDVPRQIGAVFAAKAGRERLMGTWADLRVQLEALQALADLAATPGAEAQYEQAATAVRQADQALDEGDELIAGLSGAEATAAYARAATALQAATGVCRRNAAALRQTLLARPDIKAIKPATGPPLWVGSTHVNGGLAYPSGPSRQWYYEQTLKRMRTELGWNVFDIVVGGYGAGELRPDGKALRPEALDDIAAAARDTHMAMIACTVEGAFDTRDQATPYTTPARAARARDLQQIATHLDPLATFYGFEPNNEPGLGVKPDTMFGYNDQTLADFRAWLHERYGDLEPLNAALQTTFATVADIVPPRPEAMAQIGTDDPRRALWAAWIEFRFGLMEELHRSDWQALRSVSRKPVFDRTAGDGMNWCGVPASGALHAARQDRRSRWHDALGSHVISPFLLDYQVGMSRGKRIVQSEYYWSTYGGSSDGLRYRFGGNFMHPILQNEARNFAAVARNLWQAVARGNDLFTVYFANPVNTYAQFDEGYWGPHTAYWGDHSFKGMTYAMKVVPAEVNRVRGELIGARHVPQVGLLEPLASVVHTIGTPIAADIRDPQYEAEALHKLLLGRHVQTEVVGEWCLLEGPPVVAPAGQAVAAMPLDLPPVLVVPYGVFLSQATQEKLKEWIGHGGTLIATGPVGLYDEAGRTSAQLLQAVFPGLQVERGDSAAVTLQDGSSVRRRWVFRGVAPERTYAAGAGAVLRGRLGQGEVIVTGFAHLDGADVVAALLQQAVARHAPPRMGTDNPSVQLYLCRRGEALLVYAINEDHANPQPARLIFDHPYEVADLRCGLSVGVRPGMALTLLPGEGRVLRLTGR